jgi:hypothetical protein
MPPTVLKVKGKNVFSVIVYKLRLFAVLLPLALSSPLTVI